MIDGTLGSAQFENERCTNPEVKTLMSRIVLSRDAKWNTRAPRATPAPSEPRCDGASTVGQSLTRPGFSLSGVDEAAVIAKFHAVAAAFSTETHASGSWTQSWIPP